MDFFNLSSAIATISGLGLFYIGHVLRKKQNLCRELEDAAVYTPASLTRDIGKGILFAKLKRNPRNHNEYFLNNVLIEGDVKYHGSIFTRGFTNTQLIYSYRYKQEIYPSDSSTKLFTLPISGTVEVLAQPYFALQDPITKHFCLIKRNYRVNADSALQRVSETTKLVKLNTFEKFIMYTGKILQIISFGLLQPRGISLGWTENELGIALGSALTVFGQVTYNVKERSLYIDTPLYFLKEKVGLVRILKKQMNELKGSLFTFGLVFVVAGGYLVGRYIQYYKRKMLEKEEENLAQSEKEKFSNLNQEYQCIICLERARNVILTPCMHFSICFGCYKRLRTNACPVCKKPINDIIKILFVDSTR